MNKLGFKHNLIQLSKYHNNLGIAVVVLLIAVFFLQQLLFPVLIIVSVLLGVLSLKALSLSSVLLGLLVKISLIFLLPLNHTSIYPLIQQGVLIQESIPLNIFTDEMIIQHDLLQNPKYAALFKQTTEVTTSKPYLAPFSLWLAYVISIFPSFGFALVVFKLLVIVVDFLCLQQIRWITQRYKLPIYFPTIYWLSPLLIMLLYSVCSIDFFGLLFLLLALINFARVKDVNAIAYYVLCVLLSPWFFAFFPILFFKLQCFRRTSFLLSILVIVGFYLIFNHYVYPNLFAFNGVATTSMSSFLNQFKQQIIVFLILGIGGLLGVYENRLKLMFKLCLLSGLAMLVLLNEGLVFAYVTIVMCIFFTPTFMYLLISILSFCALVFYAQFFNSIIYFIVLLLTIIMSFRYFFSKKRELIHSLFNE